VARVDTDLDPQEERVLGALLEKQRLTPDAYPLTLNGLRLACNQSTNRDPVVDYDDAAVRDALARLTRRGYARLASGPGSRAPKYRHLLSEELGLAPDALAVLAVLLLRGPQTPGELRARSDRLYPFADAERFEAAVSRLAEMGILERIDRRPGQKEDRYSQRMGEDARSAGPTPAARPAFDTAREDPSGVGAPAPPAAPAREAGWAPPVPAEAAGAGDVGEEHPASEVHAAHARRIDRLEGALSMLRNEVGRLRGELDRLREELGDSEEEDPPGE
jgi:uncharacterized protein